MKQKRLERNSASGFVSFSDEPERQILNFFFWIWNKTKKLVFWGFDWSWNGDRPDPLGPGPKLNLNEKDGTIEQNLPKPFLKALYRPLQQECPLVRELRHNIRRLG